MAGLQSFSALLSGAIEPETVDKLDKACASRVYRAWNSSLQAIGGDGDKSEREKNWQSAADADPDAFKSLVCHVWRFFSASEPAAKRIFSKILFTLCRDFKSVSIAILTDEIHAFLQSTSDDAANTCQQLFAILPLLEYTEVAGVQQLLAAISSSVWHVLGHALNISDVTSIDCNALQGAIKHIVLLCQQACFEGLTQEAADQRVAQLDALTSLDLPKETRILATTAKFFILMRYRNITLAAVRDIVLLYAACDADDARGALQSVSACRAALSILSASDCFSPLQESEANSHTNDVTSSTSSLMTSLLLPLLAKHTHSSVADNVRSLAIQTLAAACSTVGSAEAQQYDEHPAALDHILAFVFHNWEDPVQIVKSQTQKMLTSVLKSATGANAARVMSAIISHLHTLDAQSKGFFSLSAHLVKQLGWQQLVAQFPEIKQSMIQGMRTKALAVGISNIYTACLQDIAKRDNAISEWQEQWQSMVLTLLMSPDNESARTCAVCWMRPTAKALPSLLAPLIDAIEAESVGGDEHGAMQAMLLLLSAACKQAVLSLDVILEDPRLRHVIVQSMHAADEDLQKEAISIILVSQTNAKPSQFELDACCDIITSNIASSSASLRQVMFASVSSFLSRLVALWTAAHSANTRLELALEDLEDISDDKMTLQDNAFSTLLSAEESLMTIMCWLADLCLCSLSVDCCSYRVAGALTLLQDLVRLLSPLKDLAAAQQLIASVRVRTFFPLFKDRSNTIRKAAVDTALLLDVCLEDVSEAVDMLFEYASKPHLSNTEAAAAFAVFCQQSLDAGSLVLVPSEVQGGVYNVRRVAECGQVNVVSLLEAVVSLASAQWARVLFGTHADIGQPCYGYLICIDSLLTCPQSNPSSSILKQIYLLCVEITDVAHPLMNQVFSEGEAHEERFQVQGDLETFAWMLLKSVASLFERVILMLLSSEDDMMLPADSSLVASATSFTLLHHFHDIAAQVLLTSRHRGVIEAFAACLTTLCERISSSRSLKSLPSAWLTQHLDMLRSDAFSDSISFARRGAGLPYLFNSLIHVSKSQKSAQIEKLMSMLLALVDEMSRGQLLDGASIQTHTMYILKFLMRDASLSNDMYKYLEPCLTLAFNGFSSPSWVVRNASMHLFSDTAMRLHSSVSTRSTAGDHLIPLAEFVSRFPQLSSLMEAELVALAPLCLTDSAASYAAIPKLHAILLIYVRLRISESCVPVSAAVEHALFQLLASRIFAFRQLGAAILSQIVLTERALTLAQVVVAQVSTLPANLVHGLVLLMTKLTEKATVIDTQLLEAVELVLFHAQTTDEKLKKQHVSLISSSAQILTTWLKGHTHKQLDTVHLSSSLEEALSSKETVATTLLDALGSPDKQWRHELLTHALTKPELTSTTLEVAIDWLCTCVSPSLDAHVIVTSSDVISELLDHTSQVLGLPNVSKIVPWALHVLESSKNERLKDSALGLLGLAITANMSYFDAWASHLWSYSTAEVDPIQQISAARSISNFARQQSCSTNTVQTALLPSLIVLLHSEDEDSRQQTAESCSRIFGIPFSSEHVVLTRILQACDMTTALRTDGWIHKMLSLVQVSPPSTSVSTVQVGFEKEAFNTYWELPKLAQIVLTLLTSVAENAADQHADDLLKQLASAVSASLNMQQLSDLTEAVLATPRLALLPGLVSFCTCQISLLTLQCRIAKLSRSSDEEDPFVTHMFDLHPSLPCILVSWQKLTLAALAPPLVLQAWHLFGRACMPQQPASIQMHVMFMMLLTSSLASEYDMSASSGTDLEIEDSDNKHPLDHHGTEISLNFMISLMGTLYNLD